MHLLSSINRAILVSLFIFIFQLSYSQTIEDIISDICSQLSENQDINCDEISNHLYEIYTNKININTATYDELQQLIFLNDKQIENILLFVHQHPLKSLYELKLIHGFMDYELRNLSYFVTIEGEEKQEPIYLREIFHKSNHEIYVRTDTRNLESFQNDPLMFNVRYKFRYLNHLQFGFNIKKQHETNWNQTNHGEYIQLEDIGPLKKLVLGNFQAQFGQGLVMGNTMSLGKNYFLNSIYADKGINKVSSVGDDYNYLHGIAATFKTKYTQLSALYSLRQNQDGWHHVIGTNATFTYKQFKIGFTAIENIFNPDSLQFVGGLNARYNFGKYDLFGEIAIAQNDIWGLAGIIGARFYPINGLDLILLYRDYSSSFSNPFANSFAESSNISNERGFYIGTEIRLIPKWNIKMYVDGFKFPNRRYQTPKPSNGYDLVLDSYFELHQNALMSWKIRAKYIKFMHTYSLRYFYNWQNSNWTLRTRLDGNIVKNIENKYSFGYSITQDIHYSFTNIKIPITLQLRLQGFNAQKWDNRIYMYENDVLYSFSIPAIYGLGGKIYLNSRFKIHDIVSLYLKVCETIYADKWAKQIDKKNTDTDIHISVRISI